jgi:hypothetical protein
MQADYIRKKNKFLKPIFDWVAAHGNEPIIPFSGAYESEVGGGRVVASFAALLFWY